MKLRIGLVLFLFVFSANTATFAKPASLKSCLKLLFNRSTPETEISFDEVKELYAKLGSSSDYTSSSADIPLAYHQAFQAKVREVISFVVDQPMNAAQKAKLWEHYVTKIQEVDPHWSMELFQTRGGQRWYSGAGGPLLVIDTDGKIFKGVSNLAIMDNLRNHVPVGGPLDMDPLAHGLRLIEKPSPLENAITVEKLKFIQRHSTEFQQAFNQKQREIILFIAQQPIDAAQKAKLWEHYASKLSSINHEWSMTAHKTTSGQRLYMGTVGHALVFEKNGKVFKGVLPDHVMKRIHNKAINHNHDPIDLKNFKEITN